MDNGMVFLISMVHTIMDVAYCLQRRDTGFTFYV
jgi:hypothetical protein